MCCNSFCKNVSVAYSHVLRDERAALKLKAEQHRAVAPEANVYPRLVSLITHQLQLRVTQEAELLYARAQTRALGRDREPFVATLRDVVGPYARAWEPNLQCVPTFGLRTLMPDEALRHRLLAFMRRTSATGRAWTVAKNGDDTWTLVRHRHTAAMATALWRLSTWIDSGQRLESHNGTERYIQRGKS